LGALVPKNHVSVENVAKKSRGKSGNGIHLYSKNSSLSKEGSRVEKVVPRYADTVWLV